ncbi:hypothetical protein SAMN02910262_02554 [[Clostridium] aminophilum]|uniref:Uncharacterized protein n=1 Tax=[Clostridium] aminophilum TaxID=1526 RepID=A0A1I6KGR5_9FIRM|nr:hypothetical protein SAMN02910262_02554 [[Clostridium] aminophilum]
MKALKIIWVILVLITVFSHCGNNDSSNYSTAQKLGYSEREYNEVYNQIKYGKKTYH